MTGLYVHMPFCITKCPYCDFFSVKYNQESVYQYAQAVIRNIAHYNEPFDTVYFGGGTPSLAAWEITQIMGKTRCADDAEATIEANPGSMSTQNLVMLRNSGINRISIGVQSFSDSELNSLGRKHTAEKAINAIRLASDSGFNNISVDLMLGTPYQTIESVKRSIEMLSHLPVTHVSAYLLKVEQSTPFAKRTHSLPDEQMTAAIYFTAVAELQKIGFRQYEISNFAKPGFQCRHNLKYWNSEEYLGIGSGAHSYYNNERFYVEKDVDGFINAYNQNIVMVDDGELDFADYAMLKLRLTEGISFEECERFGVSKETVLARTNTIPRNYLAITPERLSLTTQGFIVSNQIIGKIIHGV